MALHVGPALIMWIYEKDTPEVYAEMCERFGLENETAPGGQTEDGALVGIGPMLRDGEGK